MSKFLALIGLLAVSLHAYAQPYLSEAEAVRIGLERSDFAGWLEAGRAQADGLARTAGQWDNPEIEYSYEEADLAGGAVEDHFYWLRQRFNLAGVHGLERRSARFRSAASGARIDLDRNEQAALIRRHFYDALAASSQAEAVDRWHDRLAQLVADVDERARAGDASRFDALRLRHELAALKGDRLETQARAASARDRLFGLIEHEPVELAGELLPPMSKVAEPRHLVADHPELRALNAEIRAAELSARAAERGRWPEMTLGVGRRELDEPGISASGNLFMVGLEVPLFDRGAGRAQAESAQARRLAAERELMISRLTSEIRSAARELEARRSAALALSEIQDAESLAEIAESAYRAGEIGVLELIDAHRTELAASRERIRRALAARQSHIELQLMRGEP
ncbi:MULTISPECIES: TolC family protein [unclassified Wenzhouxiangella]|uniref:TolC family protein n=1 Tax=unclassified Wenzhouxiangella TaxID=2613841 RepID=UPI0015F27D06|nr:MULTISPECIES: TolC family protein [unclassified Wenzhouxiangella]